MYRAWSTIEIKGIDEASGVITGIASTPSPDRSDDIVLPDGAVFRLPIPLLWQHDHRDPIGKVTKATITAKGIEIVAKISLGITEEIDRYFKLIKAGLVRGLSIGFKDLDAEPIEGSCGVRFKRWEWLELSAVTIPANAEASIATVKTYAAKPAASGTGKAATLPGASGSLETIAKGKTMKTIAEQIASLEAKRAANAGRMTEIMQKSVDEGRSTDTAEQEEFDTLEVEVATIDADLKRFRSLEKAQAGLAVPVNGLSLKGGSEARGLAPVVVKAPALPPGIGFARLARVKALATRAGESPRHIAKSLYGEESAIYGIFEKAAVAGATTSHATWAKPLVGDESAIFADFVEFLRPLTILGRFGANGIPSLRRVPFRTALIGQTSGGAGYWVGEGKAKPLTKFDFTRTTLEPNKVANIAVATEETLRDSSPSAEALIRDSLVEALRERLDRDFINPAKAAAAGVSPASVTNGVVPIASSGVDADAVRADIKAMFGAFIAANNAPTSGVWVMSSTLALALALMLNPLGQPEFPGITMTGGVLFGLPVITSEYVPVGYVALMNASDIYFADDGEISVDMSREASLEMADNPTGDATTGTGANLVSLWQTNAVGFRAERTLNWAKRRASAVALLSGVDWGAPVTP